VRHYTPSLYVCHIDGTSCVFSDLSSGQGPESGWAPSAVFDTVNQTIRVVTRNDAKNGHPALFSFGPL
jgi:hypothetical protein